MKPRTKQLIHGVCPHDCPDRCAYLVEVDAEGRAVRLTGDPDHPVTKGFLCPKVASPRPNRGYIARTYHPERLLYPQRRVGPKGEGRFQRISWAEALDEIAQRLKAIVRRYGSEAVYPYAYGGTLGLIQGESMDRRFFGRLGASQAAHTLCSSAGTVGYAYSIGANVGILPEDFAHARLILLWGTNTLTSNVHLWPFVQRARRAGAEVIAIDPVRTRTAAAVDRWLPIRPGTDGALALAMMQSIVTEALYDEDYVRRYTLGFDQLVERLSAWTPERVATITDIPAKTIVALARQYATTRPAAIRLNYGLQRHGGGGMAVRNIALLPALTGAWRQQGGGALLSSSDLFPFNEQALRRPALRQTKGRKFNMTRLGDTLSQQPDARRRALVFGDPNPAIKALFVYNSNPATIAPDQNSVIDGLRREDLFTVVLEHFQTDTADYADILLPATTQLEHWDLLGSYGHGFVSLNQPAIAPLGESKSNSEIFRLLAARMAFVEPYFRDNDLALIQQALNSDNLHLQGISLDRLLENGYARLNLPEPFLPFAEGHFYTPSGKCEFYSAKMARDGFDPLPTYNPPREVPTAITKTGPLACITASPHYLLNSTFANVPHLLAQQGEPTVTIHPADAAPRGIRDGNYVWLHNARGKVRAKAVVAPEVKLGVVSMPGPWWRKLSFDEQGTNILIAQNETDLGGGPTYYDLAVWLTPVEEASDGHP